ncbi:MAG: hypothetical protein HY877_08055 [Deltaproteobacteria bacterium]|nr:hypothetical protein [Deltaproteobacteria bacterium]
MDRFLDRQTFGYHFQLARKLPHTLEYRNDLLHSPDGISARLQWFTELNLNPSFTFRGEKEVKLGLDFGGYDLNDIWVGHFMVKLGPTVYAGYQTAEGNTFLGVSLDLNLHHDFNVTQRWGLSFFVGGALGAYLGTKESDTYKVAKIGLQLFHF